MAGLSKMFKKSHSSKQSQKHKNNTKTEDRWFCFAVVVIVVLIAFIISYSIQNSNEKFIKSDYHISLNNHLYNIQSENGTVMLVNFKGKFMKKSQNQTQAFQELFEEAKNKSKFAGLSYEVLKTMKLEVLVRFYLQTPEVIDQQNISVNIDIQQEDISQDDSINTTNIKFTQQVKSDPNDRHLNGIMNTTTYHQYFDNFLKFLKKSKKILVIEYRHFNTQINPKQRSQYMQGHQTKSRDTLDYKIRFHHGEYFYIDPVKKNVTKDSISLEDATQIIDDIPSEDDILQKQQDQSQQFSMKTSEIESDRIILNKYEKMMSQEENGAEQIVLNYNDNEKIETSDNEEAISTIQVEETEIKEREQVEIKNEDL